MKTPLHKYRITSNKSSLISSLFDISDVTGKEPIIAITPAAGKKSLSFFGEEFCEELTHSHLFPTENFSCQVKRDTPPSPKKYFNQQLLNYT